MTLKIKWSKGQWYISCLNWDAVMNQFTRNWWRCTRTKHSQKKRWNIGPIEDVPRSGRPPDPRKRSLVQALIENDLFITIRQIARKAGISPTIVINILTKELGYNYLHLRWIPHRLTFEMKKRRIEQSRVILDHLQTANKYHFTNIITGD